MWPLKDESQSPARVKIRDAITEYLADRQIQNVLGSGAREQEVMFASWRDLDFAGKTFHVTEKPDLGFKPKDREECVVPSRTR